MTDFLSMPPVRVRTRIRNMPADDGVSAPSPRLVVDTDNGGKKKRQPNRGSMKPGETRNPNGRPKGAKGMKPLVRKILSEMTTIRTAKGPQKISLYHALLLKEMELAFKGEWRARVNMLQLARWAIPEEGPDTAPNASSTNDETDHLILQWFEEELLKRSQSAQKESGDGR